MDHARWITVGDAVAPCQTVPSKFGSYGLARIWRRSRQTITPGEREVSIPMCTPQAFRETFNSCMRWMCSTAPELNQESPGCQPFTTWLEEVTVRRRKVLLEPSISLAEFLQCPVGRKRAVPRFIKGLEQAKSLTVTCDRLETDKPDIDGQVTLQSALTMPSTIFLASANSIIVLSRKNSSFSTPA